MTLFFHLSVDIFSQFLILRRISRVLIVELDMISMQVFLMLLVHPADKLFRSYALFCLADHHRGSMGIIGAHISAIQAF